MMSSRKRNAILEEFIEIYKSEPCIWRLKDKEYHDRNKRAAAYEKLIIKLRELEPNATKEDVVKKINALRSNVHREKRKVEESTKSGASGDEIYKPSLWYYDMFEFLGDQDIPRTSQSNIDEADQIEEIADARDSNETLDTVTSENINIAQNSSSQEQQQESAAKRPRSSRPGKKNNEPEKLTNEVLTSIRDHFKRPVASPPPQEDRYL
ncbi:unnamed protein product [Parnassius mnemosyne]|uniref:MADF domain-containing protein n=1 Tax=Parnassius mnemosyne TaxID=213953 RepID=A0AAV1KJH9_9NEOP